MLSSLILNFLEELILLVFKLRRPCDKFFEMLLQFDDMVLCHDQLLLVRVDPGDVQLSALVRLLLSKCLLEDRDLLLEACVVRLVVL